MGITRRELAAHPAHARKMVGRLRSLRLLSKPEQSVPARRAQLTFFD